MRWMVVGFMFSRDNNMVVLIKKAHPGWQIGLLNGVGGHRISGEGPREAMAREFMEEAGVQTGPGQWVHKLNLINLKVGYELAVLHMSSDLIGKAQTMTDEQIVVIPTTHANSQKNRVVPNLDWMIPLCLDPNIKPVVIMEDTGSN